MSDNVERENIGNEFSFAFLRMSQMVHNTAKEKGWWDDPECAAKIRALDGYTDLPLKIREEFEKLMGRNDGELLALCQSELSEALEGLRHGNPPDDKIPAFTCEEAELADVIIRIMDISARKGLRVGAAVVAKAKMNKGRERKHGKAF